MYIKHLFIIRLDCVHNDYQKKNIVNSVREFTQDIYS